MKPTTNRVHQNGSTKAVKSQAKTAAQENVTFVITCKETGELAAKFDVPRPFHVAMIRDALRRGISLQQWIENAVKEKMSVAPPPISSSNISPNGLAALDTLDLLENCASAAIALAMMNANKIKDCAAANAGWEDFDSPSILAGTRELPRFLADQLESELSDWRYEVNQMVQESAQPGKPVAGRGFLSHNTETAVNALNHLVELQGDEISNRHKNGAFATSLFITESLKAAFDNAWVAWRKLSASVHAKNPERIPQAA